MATSVELGTHHLEYHFPSLKQGEVSPCKIMVCILIREYFTHFELKLTEAKTRIAAALFFHRLVSMKDISYTGLVSLFKEHWRILPGEVLISFLRTIDNLEEENSCFLNELVVSIIDMIDTSTSQTIMLRKRITKGSPIGKFLRLVMLSIRKMSYPQVSYSYKQFWAYAKRDNLVGLRSLLQEKIPLMLAKGFLKLYFQQHPYLIKGTPKPGLDGFSQVLRARTSKCRSGLGPSLNPLPIEGKLVLYGPVARARRRSAYLQSQATPKVSNKRWIAVKWYARKIIERTVRTLCSEFYTTGTRRFTPSQISVFIDNIRLNPSSQAMHPQMHFLEYLNCIQVKDLSRSTDSLRTTFDLKIKPSPELNNAYGAYHFALLYDFFGFKDDATRTLNEAFEASHVSCDKKCLHYCNNLWASMRNLPYKGAISESVKEMDKSLSYLHSYNVTFGAFSLQGEGGNPSDILKNIWKSTTSLDFEQTESLLLIALANLFSLLGDNASVGFVSEVLLNTGHLIKWPMRSYASALVHLGSSSLMEGEFPFSKYLLEEYGQSLFQCDGSVGGGLFGKHKAVYEATKCFLGRKPIEDSVIATIHAYDPLESYYWNAYNKMIQKDWQRSTILIRQLWDSLKVKSCENCDLTIRILLLEAEINCINRNPTEALQRLFEAHRLAVKLSADFYIMLSQLGICTIQIFLGLPSTAMKNLHTETLVKCRAACGLLRAKLCVLTAKLSLKFQPSPRKPASSFTQMDLREVTQLFKTSLPSDCKPKQPKRPKKSHRKMEPHVPTEETPPSEFLVKVGKLLKYAERTFKNYENDYLRLEVLSLQEDLYRRTRDHSQLEEVEKEISQIKSQNPFQVEQMCII